MSIESSIGLKGFEALMRTRWGARLIVKNIYKKALDYTTRMSEKEPIECTTPPFFIINDDIKAIKMATYIKCDVHGDYSSLIIAGEPREQDLKEAWNRIQLAKNDATKDNQSSKYAKLTARIQELGLHIANVENVCRAFMLQYDERLADRLREMGYDYPFTEDSYMDNLRIVGNELMTHSVKLEEYKKEHAALFPKSEKKQATEKDYMDAIDEIISWRKLSIAPSEWVEHNTVMDYCIAMGKYRSYVDKMNEEYNKD